MFKKITHYLISLSLIILFISACKKQESYLQAPGNYATIAFVNNSTVSTADFGVKYNGEPMGQLVLVGPGNFTFYNKKTGDILLEKQLDVKASNAPWYFFQPDKNIEPQLLTNLQTDEPAPKAGYFKIKIANLSKTALPYAKLDIVINALDENFMYVPYDTLKSIGSQLDTAGYYQVKEEEAHMSSYAFSFIDHETQQPVLDKAGNIYIAQSGIYTGSPRDIYTFYLTDPETFVFDGFIFRNDKYYDIIAKELFK